MSCVLLSETDAWWKSIGITWLLPSSIVCHDVGAQRTILFLSWLFHVIFSHDLVQKFRAFCFSASRFFNKCNAFCMLLDASCKTACRPLIWLCHPIFIKCLQRAQLGHRNCKDVQTPHVPCWRSPFRRKKNWDFSQFLLFVVVKSYKATTGVLKGNARLQPLITFSSMINIFFFFF